MDWLEKLKGLFNIKVNSPLVKVTFINNSYNNSETNNRAFFYDSKSKNGYVNTDFLTPEVKKELEPIVKGYIDEGYKLLQTETAEILRSLYQYEKNAAGRKKDQEILDFFEKKIPPQDIEALEASLFLRKAFQSRKADISKLKDDIRASYGDRGNNICNLCSAGYFEKYLIPLYKASKEKFTLLYEIIVTKAPLAVFVHKSMSQEQITDQIESKIGISRRYGIDFIHIHGIGRYNVNTILRYFEEHTEWEKYFTKKVHKLKGNNIIIIELSHFETE